MTTAPETRREAQRLSEHVTRKAPFTLRSAENGNAEENDGYTLDGYGAVFNRETIIDSWEGRFREKIAPGSMKKSFRENPPIVQFDHGHHSLIGSLPIASLRSIAEEVDPELAPEGGAHVVARLFENWLIDPVRDAIREGAINGMSFRFGVVKEDWHTADGKRITSSDALYTELERTWFEDVPDDELPVRTLRELRVPEIGPVVWPAYVDTSVSVRSKVIDLGRLHDPEQRKLLARAVYLVDTDETTEPDVTPEADTHSETPALTDTPRTTDAPSAGEHASPPQRGQRAIDLWLRKSRDVLLTIEQNGKTL